MSVRILNNIIQEVNNLAITESYYCYLRNLVKFLRPNIIVELGTDRGASTLMMLSAIKNNGCIYTIDIEDRFPIYHLQLKKIISNDLEVNVNKLPEIDLLFIDSNHTVEHVNKQFDLYLPKVKLNGIVVMDDINLNNMYSIWEKIPYPKIELNHLHNSGFGIFIKDKEWEISSGTLQEEDLPATS